MPHQDSTTDMPQPEGEAPEEPPHASQPLNSTPTIPLPPPDSDSYEKSPGHTYGSLKKLVEDQRPPTIPIATDMKPITHPKPPSMASSKTTNTSHSTTASSMSQSPPSSPTFSEREWPSAPSTRPNSQAPSRAPSMSGGVSGGKLLGMTPTPTSKTAKPSTTVTPATPNGVQRSLSSSSGGAAKTEAGSHATDLSSSTTTVRPKPASVHSADGEKHKFTLKDLLASGPKLARRSSQKSVGSSRRSDTESLNGDDNLLHRPPSRTGVKTGSKSGRSVSGKSAGGESSASLSQKYGVCQKVAIGKGATSVVRLAHKWDRSEEKLYAIKEFRKRRKNETEKEYVKKLTAEFCISSTLHHPNIVETVDLVQDESAHWCEVMEFCEGGDLYAAIKKGGMSPSEVECCFKQICKGVEYLHSQGVAHRDIKPENLFFDTRGCLKIGDYGASTVYRLPWESTIHMSTGLCGSEPYIAPEQFLGKPYDARLVDIWAIGIVYYCLHFSELPWRAAQQSDSLYASYAGACAQQPHHPPSSIQPSQSQSSSHSASSSSSSSHSTTTTTSNHTFPPMINNLSPRACRSLIRRMLEPNPKERATIEEVMRNGWMKEIEVCLEVDKDKRKHVHVSAQAMGQAGLNVVRD